MFWLELGAILVALGAGVAGVFGDTWNKSDRRPTAAGWGVLIFLVVGAGIAGFSAWNSARLSGIALDPILYAVLDLREQVAEFDYLNVIAADSRGPRSNMAGELIGNSELSIEVACDLYRKEWVAIRPEIDPQARESFAHIAGACDLYAIEYEAFIDVFKDTLARHIDTLCHHYRDPRLCAPIDQTKFVTRIEEIFSMWPKDLDGQPLRN